MRWSLIAVLICAAAPAASYTNMGLAQYIESSVADGDVFVDQARRQDMAEAIQRYWVDIDTRLPRLSPTERDWLMAELDATNPTRIARAVETREYHLEQLSGIVDLCIEASAKLVDDYKTDDTAKFEMIDWTDVAACYHGSNGSISAHLEGAELRSGRREPDGFTLDRAILSSILTVVIPSAMADTMGWTLNPG